MAILVVFSSFSVVLAAENNNSLTQGYVKSSCSAYPDAVKNQKNIQKLEKVMEAKQKNIDSNIQKVEQYQLKIEKLTQEQIQLREQISELASSTQTQDQKTIQTKEKAIASKQETIDSYVKNQEKLQLKIETLLMQKTELQAFIGELQDEDAPSFCLSIYQAKNQKQIESQTKIQTKYEAMLQNLTAKLEKSEEKINSQISGYQEKIDGLTGEVEALKLQNQQYASTAASSSYQYAYSNKYVSRVCGNYGDEAKTQKNMETLKKQLGILQSDINKQENAYSIATKEKTKAEIMLKIQNLQKKYDDLNMFISELASDEAPSYCAATLIKKNQNQIKVKEHSIVSYQKKIDIANAKLTKAQTSLGNSIGKYEGKLEDTEALIDDLNMENENYSLMATASSQTNMPADDDNDLLSNEDEINFGTDANNKDTDGDGFMDGLEIKYGYNPLGKGKIGEYDNPYAPVYLENANFIDSDDDGLPDNMEINFGTNPDCKDSDGDGYGDGAELKSGYNPLGEGRMENYQNPYSPNYSGDATFPDEDGDGLPDNIGGSDSSDNTYNEDNNGGDDENANGDDVNEYGDDVTEIGGDDNEYGDDVNENGDDVNDNGDDNTDQGDDSNIQTGTDNASIPVTGSDGSRV